MARPTSPWRLRTSCVSSRRSWRGRDHASLPARFFRRFPETACGLEAAVGLYLCLQKDSPAAAPRALGIHLLRRMTIISCGVTVLPAREGSVPSCRTCLRPFAHRLARLYEAAPDWVRGCAESLAPHSALLCSRLAPRPSLFSQAARLRFRPMRIKHFGLL
jgi:hypothetical protein